MLTNPAAGASLAGKERPGCARRWSGFHAGMGRPEDIDLIADLAKKHAGPDVLPAGRCGGDADDQHHEEVAREFEEHLKGRCASKSVEALLDRARNPWPNRN